MDPNRVRKPMFAKKSTYGRKEMKLLKRMKRACQQTAVNGCSSREGVDRSAEVNTNGLNCSSPREPNILLSPPPTLNNPGSELVVGSNIAICNGRPQEPTKERPSDTNADTKEFLSAEALQDVLYQLYEEESCSESSKPVEVHLDLVLTNCLPEDSKEPKKPPATVASHSKEQYVKEPQLGSARTVSEQEGEVVAIQEATDSSILPVETPRKRKVSKSNHGVSSKRHKVSDEHGENGSKTQEHWQNGQGKMKSFIQDQLNSAVGDMDHTLQHLKERLDSTQCLQKHEGITTKIVKRICRLERRVNSVIAVQKAEQSKKEKLPGSDSSNMVLNCPSSLPTHTNSQSVPSTVTTSAGSKALPVAVGSLTSSIASPQEAVSPEDIICLDIENDHSPGVPTAKAPDVWHDRAHVNEGAAQTPDSRKSETVIDLTEEENSTKPDALRKEDERTASNKAKPTPEAPKLGPPQKALTFSNEVPGEVLHLPPLPKVRPLPELVTDFKGTLPPQKMELTVVKLMNPKGVALQMDVSHVDTRCAPRESIHLFFFVENASTRTPFSWTRLKVIKALPLPMFVSIGELPASGTYYFTMLSKDIYGRYGPFCDIRAVSVT